MYFSHLHLGKGKEVKSRILVYFIHTQDIFSVSQENCNL